MKKSLKACVSSLGVFIMCASLSSCGSPTGPDVLRIFNWEDYIYLNDPSSGYDEDDLVVQFETYMKETYDRDVRVIYDTFDTNETMLNALKTGKTTYDLICPSDYMIQKMLAQDMLEPFDKTAIDNYTNFVSPYLDNVFQSIKATSQKTGEELSIGDYAVGYMWGTLGLIFNPSFGAYASIGDDIFSDFTSYDSLWDKKYQSTFSIKDSVRDTYAVGLLKTYESEITSLKESYEAGEITAQVYNERLTEIFNRCSDANIEEIKPNLYSLKDNSFGFEVDSGKEDIKTNKIGANIAWSGDAVYSMDNAENETELILYYSVPENGSNIWFDGWVMPKSDTLNKDLAQEFINWMSDPTIASKNVDYIGYTSFIAGDSMVDLVRSWYDVRGDYGFFSVTFNADETEVISSTYIGASYDDYTSLVASGDDFYVYIGEDDVDTDNPPIGEVVGDYEVVAPDDISEVSLAYLFDGTLDEYASENKATTFLTYEYLSFEDEGNISVGRQFYCQYPDEATITRCAIMKDFGDQNNSIIKMWEEVKSNTLPIWAIILLVVEVVAAAAFIAIIFIRKYGKKKRRIHRLSNQ